MGELRSAGWLVRDRPQRGGHADPLRGYKFDVLEGGMRIWAGTAQLTQQFVGRQFARIGRGMEYRTSRGHNQLGIGGS